MKNLGYYNGSWGPLEEMQVPMIDRACYFGDGVYDASYSAGHVVFALEEHVDRFYRSAGLLRMEVPLEKNALMELLAGLVRKVEDPACFVYWQLSRGTALRDHPFPEARPNLWIMVDPAKIHLDEEVKLLTVEDTRFLHCNIKTLNLIPNVMAFQRAQEAGCQEAVFHRSGRVTECSRSNVHIVQGGALRTAPTDNQILPGIARKHLLEAFARQGVPVREEAFTLEELYDADEILVTNCGDLCTRARQVDGRPAGGRAQELYTALREDLAREFFEATGVAQDTYFA